MKQLLAHSMQVESKSLEAVRGNAYEAAVGPLHASLK